VIQDCLGDTPNGSIATARVFWHNKESHMKAAVAFEYTEVLRKRIERSAHLEAQYKASKRKDGKMFLHLARKGLVPFGEWIDDENGEPQYRLGGVIYDGGYVFPMERYLSPIAQEYYTKLYKRITEELHFEDSDEESSLDDVEVSDELKAIIELARSGKWGE
jgi:hypothetical protein